MIGKSGKVPGPSAHKFPTGVNCISIRVRFEPSIKWMAPNEGVIYTSGKFLRIRDRAWLIDNRSKQEARERAVALEGTVTLILYELRNDESLYYFEKDTSSPPSRLFTVLNLKRILQFNKSKPYVEKAIEILEASNKHLQYPNALNRPLVASTKDTAFIIAQNQVMTELERTLIEILDRKIKGPRINIEDPRKDR